MTIEEVRDTTRTVFEDATEAQIGASLAVLRAKGETEAEIAGFAQGMRDAALTIELDHDPLVDTYGIGGDDYNTINIPAMSALAAAGVGAAVAECDNYSASPSSGSADILEVAGVNVEAEPESVEACIEDSGAGFMFAPVSHLATKAVIGSRKEPGMWTVFNVLGPLTSPAGVDAQVLSVYDADLVPVIVESLPHMPVKRALVVHDSGMDEIAPHDVTTVAEINGDETIEYTLTPADLGLERAPIEVVTGDMLQENVDDLEGILTGDVTGPKRNLILASAGVAIYVAGLADSLEGGVEVAHDAVDSGAVKAKHDTLREAQDDPRQSVRRHQRNRPYRRRRGRC